MSDSQVTDILREVRDGLREIKVMMERIEAAQKEPIKPKRWYHYIFNSN